MPWASSLSRLISLLRACSSAISLRMADLRSSVALTYSSDSFLMLSLFFSSSVRMRLFSVVMVPPRALMSALTWLICLPRFLLRSVSPASIAFLRCASSSMRRTLSDSTSCPAWVVLISAVTGSRIFFALSWYWLSNVSIAAISFSTLPASSSPVPLFLCPSRMRASISAPVSLPDCHDRMSFAYCLRQAISCSYPLTVWAYSTSLTFEPSSLFICRSTRVGSPFSPPLNLLRAFILRPASVRLFSRVASGPPTTSRMPIFIEVHSWLLASSNGANLRPSSSILFCMLTLACAARSAAVST